MLFTEVTEMLPEMELFQYIYKTADMGCQGIDTVEEHAEKRLREELRRERQEYRAIRDEADGVRLTPTAQMELDTVFANEKPCTPEDDMAMAVRCLSQLKRLWRL